MISETVFAQRFTSLWHQVLPMEEAIVRRVNVSYRSFAVPLESASNPRRRAYINELAFRIFAKASTPGSSLLELRPDEIEELEWTTAAFVSRLRSSEEMAPPDQFEREEALALARRLLRFFQTHEGQGAPLQFAPEFPGCGILNTCLGDLLAEPTLYEVKAGARDIRAVDVRQVITYCALNFAARRYDIRRAVLLNPRQGYFAELDVHEDLARASGSSASEVYAQLLDFLSQDLSPSEVE